jgi:hypothetical protein
MKRSPKSVNNCGISLSVFKFDAAKVTLFPDITRKSPENLSVCLSKSKNDSSVFREERRAEPSAVAEAPPSLGIVFISSRSVAALIDKLVNR